MQRHTKQKIHRCFTKLTGRAGIFFKVGFTPCKAEQLLLGMKLQEKQVQTVKAYKKSAYEKTTDNRCLLSLKVI